MCTYHGSKTNVIDHYPKPKEDLIIEPFAGTARYSLKYYDHDVILVDKYDVIINIWKWLQKCSVKDIRNLPVKIKPGQNVNDFSFDCKEAKDIMGFLIGYGMAYPRKKATIDHLIRRPNRVKHCLKLIEGNLHKIRHWDIRLGSYEDIPNQQATWFIDPPYQHGGQYYVHSNKNIDYHELYLWCKSRKGQAIVCENDKANWMLFNPLIKQKCSKGIQHEVIWSNQPTPFDNVQLKLI